MTYAGSSQKYTSGWPNHQNSIRASSGSTVFVSPSDHGISRSNISAATPAVASNQTMTVATTPYIARGMGRPALFFRHARNDSNMTNDHPHEPTTTIVKPM